MAGLLAIISANANPMEREMQRVRQMAQRAGVDIQRGLGGGAGGGHSGSSGIVREFLVLSRELSAGNFTRVPGSLTLLLQRMGILKLILKDNASEAQIVAQAYAKLSQEASLAAIAATRKAAASSAAFYADTEETEATLAQAVADEEGAAAAIKNAQATQAKAEASMEAAAATEAGAVAIGPLGIALGVVLALAAGAYVGWKQMKNLISVMSDLPHADFHPEYIAKHLKASNQAVESQKEINREVQKSIDLYNSAAKAAERVAAATKEHFDHLRKMNSYERDPAKRESQELVINAQERNAELTNKINEKANLEIEARAKKQKADAIKVSSKGADEERIKKLKADADIASKYLEHTHDTSENFKRGAARVAAFDFSGKQVFGKEDEKRADAHARVQAYKDAVNLTATNDETRKNRDDLDKQSGDAAKRAADLGLSIPEQAKRNQTADQDEMAEAIAKQNSRPIETGSITSLQKIGAYTSPVDRAQININLQQLTVLRNIEKGIGKISGGTPPPPGQDGKF